MQMLICPDRLVASIYIEERDIIAKHISIIVPATLSNKREPNPFHEIPRYLLRPLYRIELSLSGEEIGIFRPPPLCALEDLPEKKETEEKGKGDVRGDEPWQVKPTSNRVKSVKEDYDA